MSKCFMWNIDRIKKTIGDAKGINLSFLLFKKLKSQLVCFKPAIPLPYFYKQWDF